MLCAPDLLIIEKKLFRHEKYCNGMFIWFGVQTCFSRLFFIWLYQDECYAEETWWKVCIISICIKRSNEQMKSPVGNGSSYRSPIPQKWVQIVSAVYSWKCDTRTKNSIGEHKMLSSVANKSRKGEALQSDVAGVFLFYSFLMVHCSFECTTSNILYE